MDPVIGIYLIFFPRSRICNDIRCNAARLCECVVSNCHVITGKGKRRKADRNIFTDRHTLKGRNAIYKFHHIAVDHPG